MSQNLVSVAAPTVEHGQVPLGIGTPRPRLSWKTRAPEGWRQTSYEVRAHCGRGSLATAAIPSSESVLTAWPFDTLVSRQRVSVQVRVHGSAGASTDGRGVGSSDWSAPTDLEVGLLDPADWCVSAVTPVGEVEYPDGNNRPWLLRSQIPIDKPIARARLYATAHGLCEFEINGQRVADEALSPGWTSYESRLRYRSYDITDLLAPGENAIGAWLADGWYRGRLGFNGGHPNLYGETVALLAQVEITFEDGTRLVTGTGTGTGTGESWRASYGPLLTASLLEGERFDQRLNPTGWSEPGFDDSGWNAVTSTPRDLATLIAPESPPVRCTEERRPVVVFASKADPASSVLDFGQNLVGRLRITVQGNPGQTITLRHAEVLQDGDLFTRSLRGATATDRYTIGGTDPETWEPRFTIHGFRYAEVTGWSGGPIAENVVARVYHTDMRRTGSFASSDPLLNRLHDNVVWGMRGNFVDLPTDCPQRDERLGWTGDLQVFAPTAAFLYDCSGLLSSWLKDVAVEQLPDGTVPWYVPVIPGGDEWTPVQPGAGWGDVAVLTPWVLYERFGDLGILEAQYPSAKAWVDLVDSIAGAGALWDTGLQLGDWLDPSAPPDDPSSGLTDKYLVSSAYFCWSALHCSKSASALGRADDAAHYLRRAEAARRAFRARYVLPGGTLTNESQCAYSLAIAFSLLDDDELEHAGVQLARLVAAAGDTITTGFLGTPLILDALTTTGQLDTAYRLLLQQRCPSWLYPVTQGATTIWERWDSLLPDGTVNPGGMTSFNHYALGAVADWLHRVVAGIQLAAPGYSKVVFAPRPGGGLRWAKASFESAYGLIGISWTVSGGELEVTTTVPTGVDAVLILPGGDQRAVGTGTTTEVHLVGSL